jgi:DNA-binding transcriptional LysR family regulator
MTLTQLQAVQEVVGTGSVSLAASRLFLSQPAVTKQIRALEDELKVKLFERSGRCIVPTPAVREILPRIERVLHELEQIRGELAETAAGVRGTVQVGSGAVLARTIMPEVVAACRQEHPRMQIVMFEASVPEQAERLRSGELRLCLGPDYLEDSDLLFEPLLSDELVLITSKDHRLARGLRPVSLEQIHNEPIIMHLYARLVEKALRRAGRSPGRILDENQVNTRTSNTETIAAFVARGLGISLVPRYIIELLNPPKIAIRELRPRLPIQFGYYQLRAATLNPLEQAFVAILRQILGQSFSRRR